MKFCKICGGWLYPQKDGSFICSKGHIEKGFSYLNRLREIEKEQKLKKESLENLIKNGILFRLMRPVKIRPPSFAQEPGTEDLNAETPNFYIYLKEIEKKYKLRLLRKVGNIFTKEIPYILCLKTIASEVKRKIKRFELSDGSYWWLEKVNKSEKERREIFGIY